MSVNKRYQLWFAGAAIALVGTVPLGIHAAVAQPANYYPSYTPDTARITKAVDTSQMILVKGSQPALAVAKYDTGALPAIQPIHNVTLLLKRSDTKRKQFDGYLAQLTNPSSPYFHHWLTADQIGTMFGPAQTDLAKVKQWLQSQGLKIDTVSPTGMMVHFSGTAAAMGQAFHTTLHSYTVNGEKHFANATAQQIPAASGVGSAGSGRIAQLLSQTAVSQCRPGVEGQEDRQLEDGSQSCLGASVHGAAGHHRNEHHL